MVSTEITRIAVLVEIAFLVEIAILVKILISKEILQGITPNDACLKTLIFLRKYQ